MTRIDELSGLELASMVAAQLAKDHGSLRLPKTEHAASREADYRPDRNIAQAWDLGDSGWEWKFREVFIGGWQTVQHRHWVTVSVYTEDDIHVSSAYVAGDSSAPAYATARCRAFLKAKGWTDD